MEICWGDAGALCVKRGFHVDISRETRCNCGSIKSVIFYHDLGRGRLPPPHTLCVEMGFTWTFPRNQDATVKLKSEFVSIKF